LLGKAKIANFPFPLLQEDVGRFQVSMHDVFICQISTSLRQLAYNFAPFNTFLILSVAIKRASFTIFCDEVAMIGSIEDFYQFDDMWVLESLHDLYLTAEKIAVRHCHPSQTDSLHSEKIARRVLSNSLIDFAAVSSAN
jgi:hypothetical protein